MSNKMNEVMKVLTIAATIFVPLTFFAGVYGMNFHYMPELEQKWGYPLFWLIMVLLAGGMVVYFRRKRWI
jgi:magnesium transporter